MKNFICFLLFGLFLTVGCSNSHTYVLNRKSPDKFFKQLDKKASGNKTEITTIDQNKFIVKDIQVVNDTIHGEHTDYYKIYKFGFDEIQKIEIKGRTSATKGFLWGMFLGVSIGLPGVSSPFIGAFIPIGTGLVGGALGAIFGASTRGYYVFNFANGRFSPKYYLLENILILDGNEKQLQIKWQKKEVWLEKVKIEIIKQNDGIDIRIPVTMYKEKFSN